MAFGIHMIDINNDQRSPCTQFKIELDWNALIQSKDKPTPYVILMFGIYITTLLFVIDSKICRKKISIVMPLNQPRDLANTFLAGSLMIVCMAYYIIKQK